MIRVLEKGLHTSIQDLGRVGYRNYGVPISGVMDSHSAKLCNAILGNAANDAVMEVTIQGPKLEFLTASRVAVSGADLSLTLNGNSVERNVSISIQKGDIIGFGKRKSGVRSYLGVAGGFQTPLVFGSRSFYQGITAKPILEDKDCIPFHSSFAVGSSPPPFPHSQRQPASTDYPQKVEVRKGPEFEMLNEAQKESLCTKNFTLGINNRMAYQLQEDLKNALKPILSTVVLPGTVQLTPFGKMMVLMRDCQTTGGYPRILQLTENAINRLAQKMQHEAISFKF